MKCKCSLNNNYEIIGLCDLEEFNEQIIRFRDRSYSQLTLSEQVIIPKGFPDLKSIVKTYININITSTKIIDSPVSDSLNNEGFNLTGKMLLVSGFLKQTVIYTKNDDYKSKCSLQLNSYFNNYIVLDKNTDKNTDKFCVYPYIEDVSLIPLDNRTINKSVRLFLFAHNTKVKPIPPPPPIEKLPNVFIFNTFDTNQEMAKVEFDKTNKKLIVSSTGLIYNNGDDDAFSFELRDSSQTEIAFGVIRGNENANNFKNALNNVNFDYEDSIILKSKDNSKVVLINYPNQNNKYSMLSKSSQYFIITPNGISSYVLSNDIILNNLNNYPVVKIQFDILNKIILVDSFGNIANPGDLNYFKATLLEDDLKTVKAAANIQGSSNGDSFKLKFSDQNFQDGDIIKLEYAENNMVVITNFPTLNNPIYNPKGKEELFQITENSLIPFSQNLQNRIIVKSVNDEEVLSVEFNKILQRFSISSTGVVADSSATDVYFVLILKDRFGTTKLETTLNSNEDGENFKIILDNANFSFEVDRLVLVYKNKSSIEISNYPNINETYTPDFNASIFTITRFGLVDASFDSKLIVINDNEEEMVTMQFIKTDTNLLTIVTSTKVISTNNLTNTEKYVQFLQYSSSNLKFYAHILGRNDASFFKSQLNDKIIDFNIDVLRISNKFANRVIITNFNDQSQYMIGIEPLFFAITKTNLIPHDLNYNKIQFKNKDNSIILFIFFDKLNANTIYVEPYSTEEFNLDSEYFEFRIFDRTETTVKFLVRAPKNDRAIFVDTGEPLFNISRNIKIGDILEISCSETALVEISDFPNEGTTSPLPSVSQRFLIDKDGLIALPPKPVQKLPNAFIFETFDTDEEMARVEFDNLNMKLIVTSTGISYDEGTRNSVFTFELLDAKHTTVKAIGKIRGDSDANQFRYELNGVIFEYNSLIILSYDDLTKLRLTNYPNQGDTYNMLGENLEAFLITQEGIVPYVLPNNIILNDVNNNPVFTMKFSILDRRIFFDATQNVTNPTGGANYFKATLYQSNATTEKITSTITGNSNANQFSNVFRNRIFQFGDVLKLEYEERDKVIITNFPDSSTPIYNPKGNEESFTITRNGLESYPPPPPKPQLLPNVITFKNFKDEVMATISFDKINKRLIVTSTGVSYGGTATNTAFALLINGVSFTIFENTNADQFKDEFNNQSFNFRDQITLVYLIGDRVEITNFPNSSIPIYNPKGSEENFTITENGLVAFK